MPRHPLVRLGLLVALGVSASACSGGSDDDALPAGTFTLRVDGGDVRTFRGSAFFSQEASDGERLFGMFLGSEPENVGLGPYVSFLRFGGAPEEGAYRLVDAFETQDQAPSADAFLGFYFDPSQITGPPDDDLFEGFTYARSGTLTLDEIDRDDAVRGRFEMTVQAVELTGFDPEDPDTSEPTLTPVGDPIVVEGEFNASFRSGLFGGLGRRAGRAARVPG